MGSMLKNNLMSKISGFVISFAINLYLLYEKELETLIYEKSSHILILHFKFVLQSVQILYN